MIYVTSDLHFHHSQSFLYEPRGFTSFIEHDECIIENWNKIIKPEDDVYCLGDLMLEDNEYGMKSIQRLNGNIHVILGNHDTLTRERIYVEKLDNVVEVKYATVLKYKKFHFYLSHYPSLTSNYDDGKKLYQSLINLCGHTHTQDKFKDMDKGYIYHCELDAHNCYPVLIDNIIEDLKEWRVKNL